jgi:hypothetical protein
MASQKAFRKSYYTTTDLAGIVGKIGDFTIDITKNVIVVYNGSTAGGIPLAKEAHSHNLASGSVAGFMAAADYTALYTHTHSVATTSVSGFMSAADKLKLDGIPPGGGGGGGGAPSSSANIPNTVALRDANGDFAVRKITGVDFIGHLLGNADTVTAGLYSTGSYNDPAWIIGLNGAKITGANSLLGTVIASLPWSKLSGTIPNISIFPNDSNYVPVGGSITGTSGGVLSTGGRETVNASANTVIIRDASGRAKVTTPVASADIATKGYVDANVSGGSFRMAATHWIGKWSDNNNFIILPYNASKAINLINVTGPGCIRYMRAEAHYCDVYVDQVTYDFILDGITSTLTHASLYAFDICKDLDSWDRKDRIDLGLSFTTSCRIIMYWTVNLLSMTNSNPGYFASVMMFLKNV